MMGAANFHQHKGKINKNYFDINIQFTNYKGSGINDVMAIERVSRGFWDEKYKYFY